MLLSVVVSAFWRRVETEQMPLPRVKADEQPVDEIVTGSIETHVPGLVGQLPPLTTQVRPRRFHVTG
ncbi:MAG TPA: hypothetical protein VLS95_08135, partial [Arthrobacter sp.]|nr:hypothetical protein [Arthrobacter sp.]